MCEFRDRDSYLNYLSKHCLLFKYLSSVYYGDRKIGNIKSQEIDVAVIIFPLEAVQPPLYCAPSGLFSRKPVGLEITTILLGSLEIVEAILPKMAITFC